MENKINIAEILKDCPKGMELNCTMYENVEFDYIEQNSELVYPIHCLMKINGGYNALVFTRNGCNDRHPNAKCVIFPKGKTTWEGFAPPCEFKDGDILISGLEDNPFIFKRINGLGNAQCYCAISCFGQLILNNDNWTCIKGCRLATEEEKSKLFQAIKDNGYKWDTETKTLGKLVEPRFKVGDRIILKDNPHNIPSIRIKAVTKSQYILENEGFFYIDSADEKYVLEDKFDINTLVPFESRVLVRSNDVYYWKPAIFGFYDKVNFYMLGGSVWKYCIPYKGNEHLLGTANDCDNYYKNW